MNRFNAVLRRFGLRRGKRIVRDQLAVKPSCGTALKPRAHRSETPTCFRELPSALWRPDYPNATAPSFTTEPGSPLAHERLPPLTRLATAGARQGVQANVVGQLRPTVRHLIFSKAVERRRVVAVVERNGSEVLAAGVAGLGGCAGAGGPDVGVAHLLVAGAVGRGLPESPPSQHTGCADLAPVIHRAQPRPA
jgi:hypothetical protein